MNVPEGLEVRSVFLEEDTDGRPSAFEGGGERRSPADDPAPSTIGGSSPGGRCRMEARARGRVDGCSATALK